jgi:dephospho-CoA kinase
MVKRVGLTGGIATGKSTVGAWLQAQGVPVFDADACVHDLLAHDAETLAFVAATFGEACLLPQGDGVNRATLGAVVFTDADKRKVLEGWLHPRVRTAMEAFFTQHSQAPLAVGMVPLIYETNTQHLYDEVWLVAASPATQLHRLCHNRGLTPAQAEARLAAQWPIETKRTLATVVIDNDGDLEALRQQVAKVLACIKLIESTQP